MTFSAFVTTAAALAASGFVLVAVFQTFLALGASWGRAAWGGVYDVLPPRLRIGSGASAVVLIVAALVVLGRTGHWGATTVPFGVFRWGTWALVAANGAGSGPVGASVFRRRTR